VELKSVVFAFGFRKIPSGRSQEYYFGFGYAIKIDGDNIKDITDIILVRELLMSGENIIII
jgi:hypothetical protein